jgi:chromosomal replication initiator protein
VRVVAREARDERIAGRGCELAKDELADPIVDESNRVAFLVMESLALGKSLDCNPLVIYGGPGVGKTTLVRQMIRRSTTPLRYYEALDFQHEHAQAMRRRDLPSFRASFVGAPGLVVDEFHRLKNKKRAQAEFSFTLDCLIDRRRPVVVASRHHPRLIDGLDASLASRLSAGFVVEIAAPRWEARMHFLRRLERASGAVLADEGVTRLAEAFRGGYGALREAWQRLRARLHATGPVRGTRLRQLVLECLSGMEDPLAVIVKRVSTHFGLKPEELLGEGQARRLTVPRQMVQFLASRRGLSAAEIGRRLGNRTRASVSYSCREFSRRLEQDAELSRMVEDLS